MVSCHIYSLGIEISIDTNANHVSMRSNNGVAREPYVIQHELLFLKAMVALACGLATANNRLDAQSGRQKITSKI